MSDPVTGRDPQPDAHGGDHSVDTPPDKKEKSAAKEEASKEIESAKEILQSVTKAIKSFNLYPADNPIRQKFMDELLLRFTRHLQAYGSARFRINQNEILYLDQPVYENTNRMESLSFSLYVDGMREISFRPGLNREEVVTLLDAMGGGSDRTDDNIVTLLWASNMPHIHYILAEELYKEWDWDETCKEMRAAVPSREQLRAVYQGAIDSAPTPPSDPRKEMALSDFHLFKLTDEELERVRLEMREEEHLDPVGSLEAILFDVLRAEKDPALFKEVLDILNEILARLMTHGDFAHARPILAFYKEMSENALPTPLKQQVHNAVIQAGDSTRILSLAPLLDTADPNQLDEFASLLTLFEKNAIPPLVDLLATQEKRKVRRTLCDILTQLGQLDPDYLIQKLDDDRYFLVRNLIHILGKIGNPKVIERLSRLMDENHPKLRKEILYALDEIEDVRGYPLLTPFVFDPETSNRIFAIRSLARKKIKGGSKHLYVLPTSPEWKLKGAEEKKEIFIAIAKLDMDDAIPYFNHFIKPPGFFGAWGWFLSRTREEEEKVYLAALALQQIGTPLAMNALSGGTVSRNKTVRDACFKALSHFKKGKERTERDKTTHV